METRVYVGLGSNLGARLDNLVHGIAGLQAVEHHRDFVLSSIYETAPVGCRDPQPFLNAVCGFNTALGPHALLALLLSVEDRLSRQRPYPNAPRPLDLDLLFFGDRQIDDPGLTVPHPRLHQRDFVLTPLVDVAADVHHPGMGRPVADLLARLPEADRSVLSVHHLSWPVDLFG